MAKKIRALIFDMDGTLADTVGAIAEGVNMALEYGGYPPHSVDAVRRMVGNGSRVMIGRALPEAARDDATVERVLADYLRCYEAVCLHTRALYDGLADVLARLSARFPIGVLSNKDQFLLEPLTKQLLDGVCPADRVFVRGPAPGLPTKPDPRLGNALLEAMGVAPDECLLIGDSDVDILTAKNLGCAHVGVVWGFKTEEFLREHGAVLLAHTPEELEKIIGTRGCLS